jgi:hypothetical protein
MGQGQVTLRFEAQLASGATPRLLPPLEAFAVDIAGDNWVGGTQIVGTAQEPLGLGDVSPGGLVMLTNRGPAGTWIDVYGESELGTPALMRLLPGETHFWRTAPTATPFVAASEDTVDLEVLALEA